jgi:hypothetical protein
VEQNKHAEYQPPEDIQPLQELLRDPDEVRADNWEELRQQGVQPVLNVASDRITSRDCGLLLDAVSRFTGVTERDVLVGAPFDDGDQRPMDHKPGLGIYVRRSTGPPRS